MRMKSTENNIVRGAVMSRLNSMLCAAAAVCLAAPDVLGATTVLSGNTYRIQDSADASYAVSSTHESTTPWTADNWPSDVPTPSFWFDCQNTNGWEFGTPVNGTNTVTKIPSLVGDGRFLTTDQTLEGTSFTKFTLKKPLFLEPDDELGYPALDFCNGKSLNSQMGMIFNPIKVNESDTAMTNTLENIGTVIAVYGSQLGGGSFLGGGYSYPAGKKGNLWSRNRINTLSSKSADSVQVDYPAPILSGTYHPLSYATVRYFGHKSIPNMCGFTGDWEVLSFICQSNDPSATGIGLGDVEIYYHSGGMRIAEMIFFTEVLPVETVGRIERYLARKWFPTRREDVGVNGRTSLGWYRAASHTASKSLATTFNVPADETLELGKLQGGRKIGVREPKVVKTGEGTLEVGDFADYGGTLESQGGRVAFGKRAVPSSVNELADGLFVHFAADDASCRDLVEVDGTNFVQGLRNLASGVLYDMPVAAYQSSQDLRPWILENAVGGKPVIDFGLTCEGATRRVLRYATCKDGVYSTTYGSNEIMLRSVFTVVAIVGAQNGGGHVMENMFQRQSQNVDGTEVFSAFAKSSKWFDNGLLEYDQSFAYWAGQAAAINATSGRSFVNGRKHDSYTQGYETPNYQVAAWCVPGYQCKYLGGKGSASNSGNLRLGEIMVWLRPLSDDELMDAQAYLARKWFGTTLAGYKNDARADVPQVQKLVVSGRTEIDVPAGASARIGTLTADAEVVKTGEGTLFVGTDSDTFDGLVVRGGSVRILEPQVTNDCQMALGPALHLDSSSANSFVLWPKNGTNFVHRWLGMSGLNCARMSRDDEANDGLAMPERNYPWLDSENALNGMPCVNFGAPSYESAKTRPFMELDRAHDNARAIFVVVGSQNGGNVLFGSGTTVADSSTDSCTDWTVDFDSQGRTHLLSSGANANLVNGEIYVDGVLTNRLANPEGWSLVEFHTLGGVQISALNCQKGASYFRGGNRYCEILVYERELSEREKVATRNYLTRKWFPARELQALPAAVAEAPAPVKAVLADYGETNELTMVEATTARLLAGDGTVVKRGAETLSVEDMSMFRGELDVAEGVVAVTGEPLTNAPCLATSGLVLHLDASDSSTLTIETEASTGRPVVSRWRSKLGDGWEAWPGRHPNSAATTNKPYYLVRDLNGHPAVDIRSDLSEWNGRRCYMRFIKDGVEDNLENIRTVFWVLGSQEGGGTLFGSSITGGVAKLTWYRNNETGNGQSSGNNKKNGLMGYMSTQSCSALGSAGYWVNGVKTAAYSTPNVLSGGYDIVAMRLADGVADDKTPSAGGLAYLDHRLADARNYMGSQRLSELIVYNRRLTDEEMIQVEAYLRGKWGYNQKSNVNDASVRLGQGATLRTTGNQFVGSVRGEGTVDGDVTVRDFVARCGSSGFTVNGVLTVAPNATVVIENLPANIGRKIEVPIASASEIAGRENFRDARFEGVPGGMRGRLRVSNGVLYAVLTGTGMIVVVQ